MEDDAELIRDFVSNRSDDAFTALVRRHIRLVYSAALRRVGGDTHLAQDVTQQVFTALFRQASSLQDRAALAGWLYTTSRFSAAQVARTERRRRAREQEVHAMHELSSSSASNLQWEQLRPVLDAAMDGLGERDREALLLRFFEGRSLAELGAMFRLTEDATRKRVDRALERLRVLLARRGIGSSSAAVSLLLAQQAVGAAPLGLEIAVSTAVLSGGAVTVGAGSALTLFQLMSSTKIVGAAVTLAVLGVATATYEVHARQLADEGLARTREMHALARARLTRAAARNESAERQLANSKKSAETSSTSVAAPRNAQVEGKAFLKAHPEVRAAVAASIRSRQMGRYTALFQELQLPPTTVASFLDLMEGAMTNGAMGRDGFLAFSLAEGDAYKSMESWRAALRAVLGESNYERYRVYEENEGSRRVAARVASALYFTPSPLQRQQADPLTQVIRTHTPDFRSLIQTPRDWDAIMSAATAILSPDQTAALDQVRRIEQKEVIIVERSRPPSPPPAKTK